MDSERLQTLLVPRVSTIADAIRAIDRGGAEIAIAVEADGRLFGTITDGDIRRAILKGAKLEDPVEPVVHRRPVTAAPAADPQTLIRLMQRHGIGQIPLVEDGRVVDLTVIRDLVQDDTDPGPVVIMAGGEGRRLRPLTEDMPKPMLPVGGKPLLEQVVEQVRGAGFSKILMSVNYRSEIIEQHFHDGHEFGVDIGYIREKKQLGTAGALGLARADIDRPCIVINGDLLTTLNLGTLARFHKEQSNDLTIGVRKCVIQVPYGVVELDDLKVSQISEKPSVEFFISAGIYAVSPSAIELVPEDETFNMTDLADAALAAGMVVGSFPIREYWLDIGQLSDYERADVDHAIHFRRSAA
jgi:dTDP-glucose pyrophosphorylase